MYPVSPVVRNIINGQNRNIEWAGTITLANGVSYPFDLSNIVLGTGSLRSSCVAPGIGSAVSSEFSLDMYIDIEVESFKGAVIDLFCKCISEITLNSWEDFSEFVWQDVNGVAWGDDPKMLAADIPMGVFNVDSAKRNINSIKLVAYDNMQKFDRQYNSIDTVSRTAYAWLRLVCLRCGVPLGISNAELKSFPNGSRSFVFADVNSNIKTYRDIISQIAGALCAVAMINRRGELTLVPCVSDPVLTITPDDRFSSEFGDYKVRYTGVYAQYKAEGIQEYFRNTEEANDTGSIIDLDCNPFLQISNSTARKKAVQAIIDELDGFTITPVTASIPTDPTLDLLDVIAYTGNHAPGNCLAPITELIMTINGGVSIKCDVSEIATNELRSDKTIDGVGGDTSISGKAYASSDFWLQMASYPASQTTFAVETVVATLDIDINVENTKTQIAWTGSYSIDADATVTTKVYVKNELIYTVTDDQKAGNHTLNVTTGHEIKGTGSHNFRIVFYAGEGVNASFAANASRLTVLGHGWVDGSIDSGDAMSFDEQLFADIAELLGYEFEDEFGNPIEIEDMDWDPIINDPEFDGLDDLDSIDTDDLDPGLYLKDPESPDFNPDEDAYTDLDGDGVYTNNLGEEYDGGGEFHISDKKLNEIKKKLDNSPKTKTIPSTGDLNLKTVDYNGGKYVNTQSLDNSGKDTSYPYEIRITTQPTKLTYNSGETIDTTGMVVTAYTVLGDVWNHTCYPNGIVPLSEIVISPETAP